MCNELCYYNKNKTTKQFIIWIFSNSKFNKAIESNKINKAHKDITLNFFDSKVTTSFAKQP
jgi:uncharacterized protein YaiL (DUF2058 family)